MNEANNRGKTALTGSIGFSYRREIYDILCSDVVKNSLATPIYEAILALADAERIGDPNHPNLAPALATLKTYCELAEWSERHRKASSEGRLKGLAKENKWLVIRNAKIIEVANQLVRDGNSKRDIPRLLEERFRGMEDYPDKRTAYRRILNKK